MYNIRTRIYDVMTHVAKLCQRQLDILNVHNMALEKINDLLNAAGRRLKREDVVFAFDITNLSVTFDDIVSFDFEFIACEGSPPDLITIIVNPAAESFDDAFERAMGVI